MSEMTNNYQNHDVLNAYSFMAFAKEFGMQLNLATITRKDGDKFNCLAFSKRLEDGSLKSTYVDFTTTTGEMSVAEAVQDRDNLRVIELDYSSDEEPGRVKYKLCRSSVKLSEGIDLSAL